MPCRPSREKVAKYGAIALIIVTSWVVNLTISFSAMRYACQQSPRTSTCNFVTAIALAWLLFQHYLAVIFAGFIVGKITDTRIIR